MSRETKKALVWIVSLFRKYKIPFVIRGGFAAKVYGSRRGLVDIDIDIPIKNLLELEALVEKYKICGPKQYIDNNFNLLLMTLKYKGQVIDICGAENQKILNKKTKQWEFLKESFSKAVKKRTYGMGLPIIPLKDLIEYKEKLSRRVDLKDVKELKKVPKQS